MKIRQLFQRSLGQADGFDGCVLTVTASHWRRLGASSIHLPSYNVPTYLPTYLPTTYFNGISHLFLVYQMDILQELLLTYLLTYSMVQNIIWKLSLGLSKDILLSLRNPKVHHRVHKSPTPNPILSQLNPVRPIDLYFPKF